MAIPATPLKTYSFFLVNYNMRLLVERCIAMLQNHLGGSCDYEILLADNSTDAQQTITELPDALRESVRVILLPGFTYVQCLNELMWISQGRWVVMMHPDVDLHDGCLARLTAFLDAHPEAGAVSPDLVYPTGVANRIRLKLPSLSVECRRLANTLTHILVGRRFLANEALWDRQSEAVEAESLMSVFMLIRPELLANVGVIDESLTVYYSNDYLCAIGRRFGWKFYYLRDAVATHFERYTPTVLFSGNDNMAYKTDPVPASPRMRADYVSFLHLLMPWQRAVAFRTLAFLQDLISLFAQLRHFRERRANISSICGGLRSILLG